jgi:hypothetical protein
LHVFLFSGRGTTEKYRYMCRVVNDPYDFLGSWCSDNFFISGTMTSDYDARLESSVWLCRADEDPIDDDQELDQQLNGQDNGMLSLHCYKALLAKFANMQVNVFNIRSSFTTLDART